MQVLLISCPLLYFHFSHIPNTLHKQHKSSLSHVSQELYTFQDPLCGNCTLNSLSSPSSSSGITRVGDAIYQMLCSIHTTTQFICYMYVSRSLTSMDMVTLVSWQKKIYPNTLTVKPRPLSTTISISGIKMGFSMFFNTSLSDSTLQVQVLQSLRPLTHSHNSLKSL